MKRGFLTYQYHYDGEKELGPTVASLSLGATSTMAFRAKAKNKINVKQKATQKGDKSDSLRITLEHGDIMVMHGSKIQQLYEVSDSITANGTEN